MAGAETETLWCGVDDAATSAEFDVLRQRGLCGARSAEGYSVQPDVVGLVESRCRVVHCRHRAHAVRRLRPAAHAQRTAQGNHGAAELPTTHVGRPVNKTKAKSNLKSTVVLYI